MSGFSQPERRGLARSQASQAHPDADLLNAFYEQTVTVREREQILAHLAVCSTCREIVALAAPPIEETLPEPARQPSAWNWSILRWGAVAASAIIVVIAVSLGNYQKTRPPMQVATETTPMTATAKKDIPQKAVQEEVPASAGMKAPQVRYEKIAPKTKQEVASRTDAVSSSAMLNKVAPPAAVHGSAAGGVVAGAPLRTAQDVPLRAGKDKAVSADSFTLADNAAKISTAPSPPPPPSPGIPATTATRAAPSQTVNVESSAPVVNTAEAGATAEMVSRSRQASTLQKAVPMADRDLRTNYQSLDQRWQVTPDGLLLSSTDEGRNWVRQLPDYRFTHVQTVGMHVWACGPDGVLMHSLDRGLNWNKVIPTDGKSTLQGDITSIVFSDVDHGALKTSNSESWSTSDAGKTWKKQ